MFRRKFLTSLSYAAVITSIPFSAYSFKERKNEIIKPPRLRAGDTVGLIAPGSFISEEELKNSIENLEKLGFKVFYSKKILAKYGYFAGMDKERAADINEMFSNNNVKAIVCARGGYGCSRVLPLLDYNLIKNNPKILIGYSDVTALLYGIFAKTGLICFHGPVGTSTFNEYSIKYFNDVLVNPVEKLIISGAKEEKDEIFKKKTITSGKARGRLAGGNLSIVTSMIGTPFDIYCEGKIIFLEEVGEEPYRIDRMLTQLIQAKKFDKAAGVVLGIFSDCIPRSEQSGIYNSFSVSEVLSERLSGLNIPVLYGMPFGHVINKITLPLGTEAELDATEQTLTFVETAVS